MNLVKWPCSPWVLVAQLSRAPAWCSGGHGFDSLWSCRGLRFALRPTLVSCRSVHFSHTVHTVYKRDYEAVFPFGIVSKSFHEINRGFYTVARRYEFYVLVARTIGTLRIYDGDRENDAEQKICFYFTLNFLIYLDLSSVFVGSKICPCSICYECVQFQIEIRKISRCGSRSPNNAEFGHFTLLFCKGRQSNVPRFTTHVHIHCFAH